MYNELMNTKFRTATLALAIGLTFGALTAEAEELQFQVASYIWVAGIEGDLSTLPSLLAASGDSNFGDGLENFRIGRSIPLQIC